ncbi:hypothetical protein SAY87_002067 [Trapa incisa]|uniref:Uncharacterized protein n=1 Tax=Trapa incisa TaxID=236973 RepID=A0AAN7PUK9_9MYRT|nr:hypothetical protein SAY87_002067 [Trapa incisa]
MHHVHSIPSLGSYFCRLVFYYPTTLSGASCIVLPTPLVSAKLNVLKEIENFMLPLHLILLFLYACIVLFIMCSFWAIYGLLLQRRADCILQMTTSKKII